LKNDKPTYYKPSKTEGPKKRYLERLQQDEEAEEQLKQYIPEEKEFPENNDK